MPGLWDGQPGLWGGSPGLYDGDPGLWSGGSGLATGGGSNPDAINLIDATLIDVQATGNPFTKVTVNVNGQLQAQEQAANRVIMQWIGVPANAALYAARMTPVSGLYDAASSALGVFVPISGNPFWSTLKTTVGTATTVGILDIRKIGSPAILASCQITQIGTKNALVAFDASFNPSPNLIYSEEDRVVVRTDDVQRRAVRGLTGHTTGKWYFELLPLVTRLRFAGVVDGTFSLNGAGGPAGENRCGVQAADLVAYPNVTVPYQFAAPGTIVRVAWDADAQLFWLAVGLSPWNGNPAADPETGIGGLSTAGLAGAGYVGATLRPVIGASVRYRLPGDPGYDLPSGFTEWSQ